MQKLAFVAISLSAVVSLTARAAEAPDAPEIADMDLEDLLNNQVSAAAKLDQPLSLAPAFVSVVSHEQIDAYGWMSLNDVLYRQHGFAPGQDYDRRTVVSRGVFEGWNNNHYLLLVDGVPFNDNIYGSAYTWEITPLFLASTVEITRGPGSALYGSNATGGVISLQTASPKAGGKMLQTRLILGERNSRTFDVLGGYDASLAAVTLGFQHFSTDGNEYSSYDGSGRLGGNGDPARFRVQDGRSHSYAFAKVVGKGELAGFSLQFHNQAWDFETGHGWLWMVPDVRESMQESRQMLVLSYRTPTPDARLQQEYTVRYQRHSIDWLQRYAPDGAYDDFYPSGIWEYINTSAHEVFSRAQLSYNWGDLRLLGGVEYTLFLYNGDDAHWANADLADAAGGFPPVAGFAGLGPWLEPARNHPVHNIGAFTQLTTGRLADILEVTAGVRYDGKFFNYTDIADTARPTLSKSYQQVSPRLAVVFVPAETLTFKAMAGRAFRAPAPSEIFGANTFSLASNIAELKPETLTTVEAGVDWRVLEGLSVRANGFYQQFKNQIAYSTLNLSTNIYSPTTAGAEGELVWDRVEIGPVRIAGFGNVSYVRLIDDNVDDPNLTSASRLVWAPSYFANLGVRARLQGFEASVQGHLQGSVQRRDSDRVNPDNDALRGADVPAWATLDALIGYRPTSWARFAIRGTNLVNTRYSLVKNNDFAFDYRGEGRRLFAQVELGFD